MYRNALAGSRTQIQCLEGTNANRYTTNAADQWRMNFYNTRVLSMQSWKYCGLTLTPKLSIGSIVTDLHMKKLIYPEQTLFPREDHFKVPIYSPIYTEYKQELPRNLVLSHYSKVIFYTPKRFMQRMVANALTNGFIPFPFFYPQQGLLSHMPSL